MNLGSVLGSLFSVREWGGDIWKGGKPNKVLLISGVCCGQPGLKYHWRSCVEHASELFHRRMGKLGVSSTNSYLFLVEGCFWGY